VAAELRLGRVANSGVAAPLEEGPAIVERLVDLVGRFGPDQVVLAGDVLDAFDAVPREARTALTTLRRGVEAHDASLVLLEGNHDTQLEALVDEPPAMARDLAEGTVVCHGHERPETAGRRYVVGHDHPAIDIDGRRRPCFLYGPGSYDGADVLGLPAFNPAVPGTAVNTWVDGEPLSPLLAEVSGFRPVIWDDETSESLVFPALRTLRSYL
jgi:metallophosphoesterase superfamily enzyme